MRHLTTNGLKWNGKKKEIILNSHYPKLCKIRFLLKCLSKELNFKKTSEKRGQIIGSSKRILLIGDTKTFFKPYLVEKFKVGPNSSREFERSSAHWIIYEKLFLKKWLMLMMFVLLRDNLATSEFINEKLIFIHKESSKTNHPYLCN